MFLKKLRELLIEKQSECNNIKYSLPSVWINSNSKFDTISMNFAQFLVNKIDEIFFISKNLNSPPKKIRIYNSFIRLTTAYNYIYKQYNIPDHCYFKNCGTFVKTIALLPYLRELGITHLYILPITQIGLDGRKGKLGSPYSTKNHMKIDENLAEDIIEMSVEEQFKALIEACHLLDIKVVTEFVLRTSSKDNDLILEHPDWFYWIKSNSDFTEFKPPKFSESELVTIIHKIESKDFDDLIPPSENYINNFCTTPTQIFKKGEKIYGLTNDNQLCEIPGAFADWPPDDKQPLWSDVTYFKLHNHPNFNYIAYNTVRMYDSKLRDERYINKDLWDYLINIIPYFVEEFDIDGVMIDMGHALPNELLQKIIQKARLTKPNLFLIEENFVISNESISKGFNALVGYLAFDLINLDKTVKLINELENSNLKIKYLGTAETHNTPRAYWRTKSKNYSIFSYLISNLLSNSIPFIHNGFELLEQTLVNTGLDFSEEALLEFPNLPLFDYSELSWLNSNGNIIQEIQAINRLVDTSNFIITKAEKIDRDILKVELKQGKQNCFLLVNYSKIPVRLEMSKLNKKVINELLNFDTKMSNKEIIFESYFAFIFAVVD